MVIMGKRKGTSQLATNIIEQFAQAIRADNLDSLRAIFRGDRNSSFVQQALEEACRVGTPAACGFLVQKGGNLLEMRGATTPFLVALLSDNIAVVSHFIRKLSVEEIDQFSRQVCNGDIFSVFDRSPRCTYFLIERGFRPGKRALWLALKGRQAGRMESHVENCRLVINNADLSILLPGHWVGDGDQDDLTALMVAALHRNVSSVSHLLSIDASRPQGTESLLDQDRGDGVTGIEFVRLLKRPPGRNSETHDRILEMVEEHYARMALEATAPQGGASYSTGLTL